MKNICFVAPSAYVLGGVATWLDELVPALRARDWSAHVILADGKFHQAAAYERAHRAIGPAQFVSDPTGTREGRVQALATLLSATEAHAVLSVNIPDAMLAVARIKQDNPHSRMRAIMTIHGLEPDLFADIEQLTPILDGVICSNRLAQARAMACMGMAHERVAYAPYGTHLPAAPRAESPTQYRTVNDRPLTVGFAGRFERFQKRVQDLAPIANALGKRGIKHRWLIAGDGPDQADIEALEAIDNSPVTCLGRIAAQRMRSDFFQQCDVLLNTSEWETGPIVVWEAMANGVAVVSSTYTGSVREAALVHDENCLLYRTGDIEQAAHRIEAMASADNRSRLTQGALTLLQRRYTPAISCQAWMQAIDTLVDLPPVRGDAPPMPSAGRLDQWLGSTLAQHVRRWSGRTFEHDEPGGEWPHTLNPKDRDDSQHWQVLTTLDNATSREPAAAGYGNR